MNAAVPAAAQRLSAAMREASRQEHDEAERSAYFGELLGGSLDKTAYTAYLRRLRTVYAALEEAVRDRRDDPLVAAVYDEDLERLPAIDADLQHWSDGSSGSCDSPAAESYRRRLESVDDGAALLAHHYTRYLGDLSGGQLIGRTLDRVYGLGGVGLALYSFPMPAKRYKDRYRNRLDALRPQSDQVNAVLSEVKLAFRLNQAVLDELSAAYVGSCARDG